MFVLAFWTSGNAVVDGSDRGARRDHQLKFKKRASTGNALGTPARMRRWSATAWNQDLGSSVSSSGLLLYQCARGYCSLSIRGRLMFTIRVVEDSYGHDDPREYPKHQEANPERMLHFRAGSCCSFCCKSEPEVTKLISGPNAYICDECVEVCVDLVRQSQDTPCRNGVTVGDNSV
jgi:hypothetical protein